MLKLLVTVKRPVSVDQLALVLLASGVGVGIAVWSARRLASDGVTAAIPPVRHDLGQAERRTAALDGGAGHLERVTDRGVGGDAAGATEDEDRVGGVRSGVVASGPAVWRTKPLSPPVG